MAQNILKLLIQTVLHGMRIPESPKYNLDFSIPVIITKVPEVTFEISKRQAGIAINYNSHELSDAIIKIMTEDKLYMLHRGNTLQFAQELSWDNVFTVALIKLQQSPQKSY